MLAESIGERPHRHAVVLTSRRWRGGHDSAVTETRRDNLISTQARTRRVSLTCAGTRAGPSGRRRPSQLRVAAPRRLLRPRVRRGAGAAWLRVSVAVVWCCWQRGEHSCSPAQSAARGWFAASALKRSDDNITWGRKIQHLEQRCDAWRPKTVPRTPHARAKPVRNSGRARSPFLTGLAGRSRVAYAVWGPLTSALRRSKVAFAATRLCVK